VSEAPLACRIDVLGPVDRARHAALVAELADAKPAVEELEHGFTFRFPSRPYLFLRVAEWIGLERQCCPFLEIRLAFDHPTATIRVSVTGPDGTKDVLRSELPLASGAEA
jgi:hypothetical protein